MSSNGWVWRMIKIISNYLLNRRNKAELNRRNFERKELMADVRNTIVKQTTPYGENGDNSNASNASNVKSIEMPLKNNNIEFVNHINIRNGMAYKINSDTPYSGNCELNELPKINYFDSLNSKTWGNAPSFVNKMYTRSMANTYGCDKDNPQRCTCKGSFLHGVPDGIWTITRTWDCWDESLSEKETISYKKGKKYGAWAVTHKAKEKYMGGTFLSGSFKNDKLNGVFLCINSGVKIIEIEYKNGLMRGKCIYRYEANGQKEFECTMKDGFKHGICTKWHPTGQKKEECHYSNGSLNDLHTVWNQDGSIKSKHSYKDGKLVSTGKILKSSKDGKLVSTGKNLKYRVAKMKIDNENLVNALSMYSDFEPLYGCDISNMTISEIANTLDITDRRVIRILHKRNLSCSNYPNKSERH